MFHFWVAFNTKMSDWQGRNGCMIKLKHQMHNEMNIVKGTRIIEMMFL